MKLRIKFAKHGAMKFIGHLDMMRFFQKAVRRAGIDIRYSEGFSPHQIMSFAAPLGVGVESDGEYMDIEVCSMTSAGEIKEALNGVMVEGVEILSVTVLPDNARNAMASVAAASYRLRMKEGGFPVEDLADRLAAFYAQPSIPYTKETKKGPQQTDLKPGIRALRAEEDGSVSMLVNAGSSGNIKPAAVWEAFCDYAGCDIPLSACLLTRLETYTETAGEDGSRLTALSDVGAVE